MLVLIYQHSKKLASAFELCDDLFVGKGTHLGSREQGGRPSRLAVFMGGQ